MGHLRSASQVRYSEPVKRDASLPTPPDYHQHHRRHISNEDEVWFDVIARGNSRFMPFMLCAGVFVIPDSVPGCEDLIDA
jgi:hypothetical protein